MTPLEKFKRLESELKSNSKHNHYLCNLECHLHMGDCGDSSQVIAEFVELTINLAPKLIRVWEAAKLCSYQEKEYGCDDMTFAPVFHQLREALKELEQTDGEK